MERFIIAAVLLTLIPGPDLLFVITQSVTRGRWAGIVFAAGLCSGLLVHTTVVSLGLGVLLEKSPQAFSIVQFAGAAYLIYLGIRTFLARHQNHFHMEMSAVVSGKLYGKGILMNLLNPKVILFFLAFFPQFIPAEIEYPISRTFLLGGIFMFQAFLIFSSVAVLADRLARPFMQNPRIALGMNWAESLLYFLIGISILLF